MTREGVVTRDEGMALQDNLALLRRDKQFVEEEYTLLLDSYFASAIEDGATPDRALRQLMAAYRRIVSGYKKEDGNGLTEEKLAVCRALYTYSPDAIWQLKGSLFVPFSSEEHAPTIFYWSADRFSLVGADGFSKLFKEPTLCSADSFSDVCETVAGQMESFGVLPIENTTDGRLSVFFKMLGKHDLKICAVCDVEDSESEKTTRLALVTKSSYLLSGDAPRHIEFSYVEEGDGKREDLLRVAAQMGHAATRLSALPHSYRMGASVETVSLTLKEENIVPFLLYLQLFFGDINILGCYIQI